MRKTVYFRQCLLIRPCDRGELRQTSWIPEKFAVTGKRLRLLDDARPDGWVVREVGPHRMAEGDLPDFHADAKGHRRRTGDALPKLTPPASEGGL